MLVSFGWLTCKSLAIGAGISLPTAFFRWKNLGEKGRGYFFHCASPVGAANMSSYFSGFVSSMKGWWNNENLEVVNGGTGEGGEETVAAAQTEERKSLWKQLSQYIGSDITSGLSLPVWIFEPHSFLQIICEPLQFSELLDKVRFVCYILL